jgi:hypothetical protein
VTDESNLSEDLSAQMRDNQSQIATMFNGSCLNSSTKLMQSDLEERHLNFNHNQDLNVLNWISKHNYWPTQIDLFDKAEEGTGEWFLNAPKFRNWVEGKNRVLWCPGDRNALSLLMTDGIAGVGKTILR